MTKPRPEHSLDCKQVYFYHLFIYLIYLFYFMCRVFFFLRICLGITCVPGPWDVREGHQMPLELELQMRLSQKRIKGDGLGPVTSLASGRCCPSELQFRADSSRRKTCRLRPSCFSVRPGLLHLVFLKKTKAHCAEQPEPQACRLPQAPPPRLQCGQPCPSCTGVGANEVSRGTAERQHA